MKDNTSQLVDLLYHTSLISKTDKKGIIIYVNKNFCEVSGYTKEELIGNTHRLINSGTHDSQFWKEMFKKASKPDEIWNGVVTNKRKNGDLYYVISWISGIFNENSEHIGYISIRHDITQLINREKELKAVNNYLDYAAKMIRHDMYSGINIYMPRGVKSIQRRLPDDIVQKYKLEKPIQLLTNGLQHTQNIYEGIYEFTNIIKQNNKIEKNLQNVTHVLRQFFKKTSYGDFVNIAQLPEVKINSSLFCTAIDNLVRNGLKYNDSKNKMVQIYYNALMNTICIEDNGRGMTYDEFKIYNSAYARKDGQKENGSGLGLHICCAIIEQHGFDLTCTKLNNHNGVGTIFSIHLN